jgi:hypothetical protein
VIFTLPTSLDYGLGPSPSHWPKTPLAYVQWYTSLKSTGEPNHNMYKIKRLYRADGSPAMSIISLTSIRQSCMLIPLFDQSTFPENDNWTTENILDECQTFLINNWRNMYTYKTIW